MNRRHSTVTASMVPILTTSLMLVCELTLAQTKPVPPPAPLQPTSTNSPQPAAQPLPQPPAPTAPAAVPAAPAAPAAPATPAPVSADSAKTAEVEDNLSRGIQAVKTLDLASAQMYFEQAFAKCDQNKIKGKTLARVYMALGALAAGYLQQIPQGTEFFKLALGIDPAETPFPSLVNAQVTATLDMVRESLGLKVAREEKTDASAQAPGLGNFWVMKHERLTQAKRLFPLGIHIEVNPMVAIKDVRLYFRLPSDSRYQVASMERKGQLYGIFIPCSAIALLDPQTLFYYIEVFGGDGSLIAREGDPATPIKIQMTPEGDFNGTQPTLPGAPESTKCNPEDAAPCPPWEPHCKDTACVSSEDCVGGKMCREGFCIDRPQDDERVKGAAIGLVISGGLGFGAGASLGSADGWCGTDACAGSVDLAGGFSPSGMFTRFMLGYYVLDNLLVGAFVRFQHIRKNSYVEEDEDGKYKLVKDESQGMKIAGLQVEDYGPMWGPTVSLFLLGNGKFLGPGQIKDDDGKLAAKQGLRAYARAEFNIFGAIYHSVSIEACSPEAGEDCDNDGTVKARRQRAAGLQALGLGLGALYGIHKNVDLGVEAMYDLLFPTVAHNFDFQGMIQVHF